MNNAATLNAFQLKMIAILAMLTDHVGAVFFPHILAFRIIGRLTVPIMAFFIAEGFLKTRSVKKYGLRLLAFALISMPPYYLVFGDSPFNILFDLLLGLMVLHFSQGLNKEYQKWGVVVAAACIALLLQTDGRLGVSTQVYLFYRFRHDKRLLTSSMVILYLCVPIIQVLYGILTGQAFLISEVSLWLRPLSLLALILIFQYNGERGKSLKYWFYAFYPGHLILIYVLMRLLW